MTLAQNLEASIAARWADYSGSGQVWAWKAGLNWSLNDQIRLRATQSRDVRAANLRDRFDQTRGGFTVSDPRTTPPGGTVSGATFSGGNPDVSPETADTTTVGIVFQPSFLQGFQTSIDWYKISLSDSIAQLSAQQLVTGCQTDPVLCQYVIRTGNTANGAIERIDSLFINLAEQIIEGVDLEMSYHHSVELLGGGPESVSLRLFGTRLTHNSTQNRGGALDERLGQIGGGFALPKNKATAVLGYTNGPFSGAVIGRYLGGGILDRNLIESQVAITGKQTINDNHVGSVFYTDLNLNFRPAGIEGLQVFGTVQNLLDRSPPRTPTAIGRTGPSELSPIIHDQIGRRYTVGVNYQF
jgi:outer membrane receptor protein involved in Fe transport